MRHRFVAALLAGGLLLPQSVLAQDAKTPVEITARAIPSFDARSGETRFGALEYRGGFTYRGSDRRLAGVSAFRFREAGSGFLAVTDTGLWFEGRISRDSAGRPTGFEDARIAPILDVNGRAQTRKGDADAEGLAIDGGRVLVSFERDHRIEAFDPGNPLESRPTPVPQPIPLRELRSNAALETVAVSPNGMTITIAEQSIDMDGNLFAAILGSSGGIFKVRREVPWHATDGAFLPGGDFLLLERRYEGFGRVGMRIRRIDGETIEVGAIVDGPVIMEADLSQEIDNMEGLDVFVNETGETILGLVSDDNGSFFQRNLYLEFRLVEDDAGASG
ncbi:esterase-like activity of phytase family protein [Aureimonas mangrovi]|uniref:esterase-like activity of phytase family protein n=1 Tax=Aureimonas mangrovi TaxID=2758041 RepID=UPI00163D419A|nr:esterase-like activity of phytase family protein [Aureimonas mangrovi]